MCVVKYNNVSYIIIIVNFWHTTLRPFRPCRFEKNKVPFSMAIETEKSCTSVFPNNRAWQQQEWNKEERWECRKKKGGHEKKKSRRPITTESKCDNNNKHNIVVFYKIWKKWNKIQVEQNLLEQSKNEKSSTLPWLPFYKNKIISRKVKKLVPKYGNMENAHIVQLKF